MTPVPRIIELIDTLNSKRNSDLLNIFSTIAFRRKNINVYSRSLGGNLIFSISDGKETGTNFTDWRFQTISENINGSYYEIWTSLGKGSYFLDRSYFHLYSLDEQQLTESEYVLLHCDASEPDDTPHCSYKQSPHLHIEVAQHPIPKAHLALYNGRIKEVLKDLNAFNSALKETIEMLSSQILNAHSLL